MQESKIYLCSDSIGDTAEAVTQATLRQFEAQQVKVKRFGNMKHESEIRSMIEQAAETGGFVAYTLVQPVLREALKEEAIRLGVRTVDIMGPMMQAFIETFNDSPKRQPGLLHQMDEAYFRRVEAIEFAVKYDDGKDPRGLLQAEVVLLGVSRTSKTPLSIFLAHKGLKVANLPLVPEVKPPLELFQVRSGRMIGLTMNAEHILKIRKERLKAVGLPFGTKYATLERVMEELEYAHDLMKRVSCMIIDVTEKAIEETAAIIMGYQ